MKKYYAITTSMHFEKTVLVPVESVKDLDEAIDLVDCYVDIGDVMVLNEQADCETKVSPYARHDGTYTFGDKDAACYQIIVGDR